MRKWLILIPALLLACALTLVGIATRIRATARERVIEALKQRFSSDVELNSLNVSMFPRFGATGEGLVLRHQGRTDVPPFIYIKKFSMEARLAGILKKPYRVGTLQLDGLQIHVPPRRQESEDKPDTSTKQNREIFPFDIQEVVADGTSLEILPRKAGKQPLTFEIYKLRLHSVGLDRPMSFRATLRNPTPPGDIQSVGTAPIRAIRLLAICVQ